MGGPSGYLIQELSSFYFFKQIIPLINNSNKWMVVLTITLYYILVVDFEPIDRGNDSIGRKRRIESFLEALFFFA